MTSPTPGDVTIYVLADETLIEDTGTPRYPDGIPDAALLAAVTAVVTALEARQQTDRVTLAPATRQGYDVTVALTLFAEPDSAIVRDAATARLARLAQRAVRLGGAISTALLAVAATLTLGTGAAALAVTAATPGAAGNQMTVALVDPGAADQALAVTVAGQALTATLATDTTAAAATSLAGGSDLATVAVEQIAAPDGVALQARTLTVEVT